MHAADMTVVGLRCPLTDTMQDGVLALPSRVIHEGESTPVERSMMSNSSSTAARTSQLPLVDIVAVKGLQSHDDTAIRIAISEIPLRRSTRMMIQAARISPVLNRIYISV